MKNSISSLATHLRLLIINPVDYLHWFLFTSHDLIEMKPYCPQTEVVANNIIAKLKHQVPQLTFNHVGSSALKLMDEQEIDICAEVIPADFEKFVPLLISHLGQPITQKPDFVQWYFPEGKYMIDVTIVNPHRPQYQKELKSFKLLQNNPVFLDEYLKIKQASVGGTIRAYQFKKIVFLTKLKNL